MKIEVLKFAGIINNIVEDTVEVSLYDDNGEESFAEFPLIDFKTKDVECVCGTMFHMNLLKENGKETIELIKIEQPQMSVADWEALVQMYKEKYHSI